MVSIPEQFTAFGRAQLDTVLTLAGFAAASTEKLVDFQIRTAKAQFADAVTHARAFASAKDAQAVGELATAYSQPLTEKAVSYSRELYALTASTQGEFAKLLDEHFTALNKQVSSFVDNAAKSAPAGSEAAVSAVKSAIAAAGQAYEALTRAGKQATEMTETAHAAVLKNVAAVNGAARGKRV
jgi:phasin family protein